MTPEREAKEREAFLSAFDLQEEQIVTGDHNYARWEGYLARASAPVPVEAIEEGLSLLELAQQKELHHLHDYPEGMMKESCKHAAESLGKSIDALRRFLEENT